MLGLKPALPRVLSFPRNPHVLMRAQTIFITETDDATAKTWRSTTKASRIHVVSEFSLDRSQEDVPSRESVRRHECGGALAWSEGIPPRS